MSKNSVVHVITGTAIGGAEMMLLRYLRALDTERRFHSVVSMMAAGPVAEMIGDLGVSVETLDVSAPRDIPRGILKLRRLIAARSPSVIHGWMYHGSLVATLALILAGRPDIGLVWAIHHSLADPRHEKRATRLVLRALRGMSGRAQVITYCSRQAMTQHADFGLDQTRARFVPNAIDISEFTPDPTARAKLCLTADIPDQRRIIGAIGRAHPMKDHAVFAQVIALLNERGLDVHGVLIGDGQPDGPAVKYAREAGIVDRLTALPARDDIAGLVPGLDLYLLTSAWGEALPLAVAEAMSAGIPAVVTDVGDCGWLVCGCGEVCAPRRPDQLADAAERMLRLSAPDRQDLAVACRDRIARQLSMQAYVACHADLYLEASGRRTAARFPSAA